ncbi:MAG: chorismate lyase [Gammaproteobacteria bacterium]
MSNDSPLYLQPSRTATALAWLGGDQPGALPEDPDLRGWLEDTGSLTARLRSACLAGFRLELLGETIEPAPPDARTLADSSGALRARRVRMFCGQRLCVCATTLIPPATLAGEPWLAGLGDRPLGDALLERGGIRRSPFLYARAPADHPLFAVALEGADIRPNPIWARQSTFRLAAGPLLVYEIFLPDLTRCGSP